jgi:hypothetical protein
LKRLAFAAALISLVGVIGCAPKGRSEADAKAQVEATAQATALAAKARAEVEARDLVARQAKAKAQADNPGCKANFLFEPRESLPLDWFAAALPTEVFDQPPGVSKNGYIAFAELGQEGGPLRLFRRRHRLCRRRKLLPRRRGRHPVVERPGRG